MPYTHPTILLIDVADAVATDLSDAGYAVTTGTLGTPTKVPASNNYYAVRLDGARAPGFAEKDILVVDLQGAEPVERTPAPNPVTGREEIFARVRTGLIDPRARVMHQMQRDVDRILAHGGVLVVFTADRIDPDYVVGTQVRGGVSVTQDVDWSNWDLASALSRVEVERDYGVDVRPTDIANRLGLDRFLRQGTFHVVVRPPYEQQERWLPLARNKFGSDVAALVPLGDATEPGVLVLLPQVADPSGVLKTLFDSVLPLIVPTIFPAHAGDGWKNDRTYEPLAVLKLRDRLTALKADFEQTCSQVERAIAEARAQASWLSALLTETGDGLVAAVVTALKHLGLDDVIDADEAGVGEGQTVLREDLQVDDRSPLLLIEVKGVNGHPSEAESLQVLKYLAGRMRDLDRTDVKGLTIVNHQRGMPPLGRDNGHTFTADVLATAESQRVGLLTAFDLYKLVRGVVELDWPKNSVADLLYRNGRIEPVPSHYQRVGEIANFFEQAGALAVQLDDHVRLATGDLIAIDARTHYVEQRAESLQQQNQSVSLANGPEAVGIATSLPKENLRQGAAVYVVRPETTEEAPEPDVSLA